MNNCCHKKPVFGCQDCINGIKFYKNESELQYYKLYDEYKKIANNLEKETWSASELYDIINNLFDDIDKLMETIRCEIKDRS